MIKTLINSGPSERGFHRLELFMRCPQLYQWQLRGALKRHSALALERGSLCHIGLAHLYQSSLPDADQYYDPIEAIRQGAQALQTRHISAEEVIPTIEAYAKYYADDLQKFKVLAVEEQLVTTFGPYRYTARADLIVRDKEGKVWIWDHKVTSRITGSTLSRYTLSGQMLGLWHLGKRYAKEDFAGVMLNIIQADGKSFVRQSVDPAPWLLRRFPAIVEATEKEIAQWEAAGPDAVWPACPSEMTCMHSYGRCPAYEICRWGPPKEKP